MRRKRKGTMGKEENWVDADDDDNIPGAPSLNL